MYRRVVLWDWELMYFQDYVYIILVYRVVDVDMSTHSSQLNHLSLECLTLSLSQSLSVSDLQTPPPHPPFHYSTLIMVVELLLSLGLCVSLSVYPLEEDLPPAEDG